MLHTNHRVPPTTQRSSRRSALRELVLALTVIATGACGSESGDPLGPPDLGDEGLTQAQAAQMFSALVGAYGLAPTPTTGNSGGGGAALVPVVNVIVDTTQTSSACPAGGSVAVVMRDSIRTVEDGRVQPSPDTTYAGTIDFSGRFDITTAYQSCGSMDSNGNVWTFDATPGLNLDFDFTGGTSIVQLATGTTVSSWNWNWNGTWTGMLNWSGPGGSGQCSVNVTWVASNVLSPSGTNTSTTNQTGTLCGFNVTVSS